VSEFSEYLKKALTNYSGGDPAHEKIPDPSSRKLRLQLKFYTIPISYIVIIGVFLEFVSLNNFVELGLTASWLLVFAFFVNAYFLWVDDWRKENYEVKVIEKKGKENNGIPTTDREVEP